MPYKERGPNIGNLESKKVENNFHQLLQQEGNLVPNMSNPKLFNNPMMTPENNIFHQDFGNHSLMKGVIPEDQDAEKSNTVHASQTSGKLSPMLEASRKRDWAEHALIKQTPMSTINRGTGIDDGFLQAD